MGVNAVARMGQSGDASCFEVCATTLLGGWVEIIEIGFKRFEAFIGFRTESLSHVREAGVVACGGMAQYTFSWSMAKSSASVMRVCFIVSRSRSVKVSPGFSIVSKSIVTHHGVPASSWRR